MENTCAKVASAFFYVPGGRKIYMQRSFIWRERFFILWQF